MAESMGKIASSGAKNRIQGWNGLGKVSGWEGGGGSVHEAHKRVHTLIQKYLAKKKKKHSDSHPNKDAAVSTYRHIQMNLTTHVDDTAAGDTHSPAHGGIFTHTFK